MPSEWMVGDWEVDFWLARQRSPIIEAELAVRRSRSLRAMRRTDHRGNKCKIVFVLRTRPIRPRISEAYHYDTLGGHNIDFLSKCPFGTKTVLRKSLFNTPRGVFIRSVVGPKSRAVFRT